MSLDISTACQTSSDLFPFWLETFSIFLGDVAATIFIALGASVIWHMLKYPGFRVGANWTYVGWDMVKMGRLPNASDEGTLQLMPNISVTSRDMTVKKVIHAVWVRERADLHNPGEIHGVLDLKKAGIPLEVRTTGGDLLTLPGPKIVCQANKFQQIFNCPIFIQTSDGEYYRAESPGNSATGIVKMRYSVQTFFYAAKQRLLTRLS